jgi:Conserved TM helix
MFIQDWASVIVGSLQNLWVGFIGTLASIIGALIILIIGLIVAAGVGALVEKIVNFIKLDKLLVNLGLQEYFDRANLQINSGKFLRKLVYWFLVVVFLLAATDILGFYSLSDFLKSVLLYLPNVIVAVLIMLATFVIAHFLRGVVRASVKSAHLHGAGFLASLTWWAVVVFGLLATFSQLGIAVAVVNALITGLIAMLAIAFGLAFGLGGKDYAAYLISKLREHTEH